MPWIVPHPPHLHLLLRTILSPHSNYCIAMSSFAALSNFTSTDSTSELYVPVHRRASIDMTASDSSRSPSPTQSHSSKASSSSYSPMSLPTSLPSPSSPSLALPPTESRLPIYSIAQLLHLHRSPLSAISPAAREDIRAAVPEISMNRKQRKAREMREGPAAPVSVSAPVQVAPRAPLGPMHNHVRAAIPVRDEAMKRPNPTRRVPGATQRRVHAVKTRGRLGLGEVASWRRTGSVQAIST